MANPLKVLTQLTASKEAQFQEAVEMQSGNTISGGDLLVQAGQISGSAQLNIGGVASFASDISASANVDVAGNMNIGAASKYKVGGYTLAKYSAESHEMKIGLEDVSGSAAAEVRVLEGAIGLKTGAEESTFYVQTNKIDADTAGAFEVTAGNGVSLAAGAGEVTAGPVLRVTDALVADSVNGLVTIQGNLSASLASEFAGAVDMNQTLNVDGAATFQSNISGAAALDIGGAAYVVSGITTDGNISGFDITAHGSQLNIASDSGPSAGLATITMAGLSSAVEYNSSNGIFGVAQGSMQIDANTQVATFAADVSASAGMEVAEVLTVVGDAVMQASASVAGDLTVSGDLVVNGTTTYLNTETVQVKDKNIELAWVNGAASSDAAANGAGITVKGDTDKTFNWIEANDAWTSSENMDLAAGKVYMIDGQEVLAKDGSVTKLSFDGGAASLSVSSNAVAIAGDLDLVDDLHVSGTLGVDGVAAFASDVTASAGLEVVGQASAQQFNAVGNAILFNGVEVITNYDIGTGLFNKAQNAYFQAKEDGTLYAVGVATFANDITASAGLEVAGAAHIAGAVDMDSTLNVDGIASFQAAVSGAAGLDMTGNAAFHNDVAMDAALNLSGSAFVNIATPVTSGKYNVNDAIRALDAGLGNQGSNINSAYAALRKLETKNFDANGMAAFTSSFLAADIEQVTVDVLVQPSGSSFWANDLLSVQVKSNGSVVCFEVSAPAMGADDKVRLIAVKESGSLA